MHATLIMGLSVLIWSFYPLAAAKGLQTMNGLELVVVSNFIAAIGAVILTSLYLGRKKQLPAAINVHKNLDKRGIKMILASTVTSLACNGLFFTAMTMAHKGGVSIIYEMWPIMALIATPFIMRKKWKAVGLPEFLISLLSLIGIGIIIASSENIPLPFFTQNTDISVDYLAMLGYVVAFIGAYTCALSVVFKGAVGELFDPLKDNMASSLICESYTRVLGVILSALAYFFYADIFDVSAINWGASLFIGIVVMIAGGGLYTLSLLLTDRPTIHILYYFVPVLAVIWLWLGGQTTVNAGLFIGGFIILAANIYLALAARKAPVSKGIEAGL